jgi:hypothetical protein
MSDEDEFENEQRDIVGALLERPLTDREVEGFRIVYPRFIDRFGGTRLGELRRIFCTDLPEGKRALAASLVRVADDLGSYDEFVARYPVTVVPPLPAYPLFPILYLESFKPSVYRVLNSGSHEALKHIKATGRLPFVPLPPAPVLRETPRGHWCAYDRWATPDETRRALQILPTWSDCAVRATLDAHQLKNLAYVAYSVDPNDSGTRGLTFHGYFYEGVTQDHDDAPYDYEGDAIQICAYGEPEVRCVEEWNIATGQWDTTWQQSPA